MTNFNPELVQIMRTALEEIMQRVPVEYSTQATKAYLAECILKAAAQGQTSLSPLMYRLSAAGDDDLPHCTSQFAGREHGLSSPAYRLRDCRGWSRGTSRRCAAAGGRRCRWGPFCTLSRQAPPRETPQALKPGDYAGALDCPDSC